MTLMQRVRYEKKLAKRARKNQEGPEDPEDPEDPAGRTLQSLNQEHKRLDQENEVLQQGNNVLEALCEGLRRLREEEEGGVARGP